MSSVFQVKAIKPKALKVAQVRLELLSALKKEGTVESRMLSGTTKYWEGTKPKFDSQVGLSGGNASLLVGPTGNTEAVKKWSRINGGTGERDIVPVRAKFLRFKPEYTAGSKPNTLDVQKPRSSGDYVYAKKVHIKGIKARNWTIVVLKKRYIPFREAMNNALETGLKKGGWN